MSDLYRLVYTSKNHLHGEDADVAAAVRQILESSQRRNAEIGVTGALMFNAGAFAQVLEGPRRGVEATFERIQLDARHSDVTVLQCGPTESRGFTNWSMAFVGQSVRGKSLWSEIATESGFDLSRMSGDAVFGMLHGLVMEEESMARGDAIPARNQADPKGGAEPSVASRIRAELDDLRPERVAVRETRDDDLSPMLPETGLPDEPRRWLRKNAASNETALRILQAALASERERTTALRGDVDDLQVALASAHDRLSDLQRERDRWAKRARLLANVLCREAEEACSDGSDEAAADARSEASDGPASAIRIVA